MWWISFLRGMGVWRVGSGKWSVSEKGGEGDGVGGKQNILSQRKQLLGKNGISTQRQ